MNRLLINCCFILLLATGMSCKKYLDVKPDQKLAVPSTLQDMESLLDNYSVLNGSYRSLGEVASDNYYLTDQIWAGTLESNRNYYLWQPYDMVLSDWSVPYNCIFNANLILESLQQVTFSSSTRIEWNKIKGSALFYRGFNYYDLAQIFCNTYDVNTAGTDQGLPIRLNTDLDEVSVRATVKQTYDRIISDLTEAIPLLPVTPSAKYHPSRPAAYGILARTYLMMQDYAKAGLYADSCLALYNTLMDYNSSSDIDPKSSTIPFKRWNAEVIFDAKTIAASALARTRAKVDTTLYRSYDTNDLRRVLFFKANADGSYAFKGNYTGLNSASLFNGIAADEMYLIRAESYARAGNTNLAIDDLNSLMIKRWQTGTFISFTATSPDDALKLILRERRKQLLFRGLRWPDLRRLNKEPEFQTTLIRNINGQTYQLLPNDKRYVFKIDRNAINLSGMPQNP